MSSGLAFPRRLGYGVILLANLLALFALRAAESWEAALDRMPLGANVTQLNLTNCVPLMLGALQSNQTVKALIFMPNATDELYFFHRVKAELTNASPSLLDAVNALTRQTRILATFRSPMLLLHAEGDPLNPVMAVKHRATAKRFKEAHFLPQALYNDRDWDFLLPILTRQLQAEFRPELYSMASWHFYRHSFAAWGLTDWEALEAIALAGKTKCAIRRNLVVFEGDERNGEEAGRR